MNAESNRSGRFPLAGAIALICFLAGASAQAAPPATPLDLSEGRPLFLNPTVDPNVLTTLDDSGSMESAFMPDSVDDNCGIRHPRYYWSGYNRLYYNPRIVYSPPLRPDGTPFPDASFNAAWMDGYENQASGIVTGAAGARQINLGTEYFPSQTMTARSAGGLGTVIPYGIGLSSATDCRNPDGTAASTGTDEALLGPADNNVTLAQVGASNIAMAGSGTLFQGANGIGIVNDRLESGERIILDFVQRGSNPAGVQRLQLRFNDPTDVGVGDQFQIVLYGPDRTTIRNTYNYADLEAGTISFADRFIGRVDLIGGAGSNIGLRRIPRYREEVSAHFPATAVSGSYAGVNFTAGQPLAYGTFAVRAFYYELRSGGDPSNPADFTPVLVGPAEQQNFANWYSYYRTRYLMARSALTRVFGVQDAKLRVAWQNLDPNNNDGNTPRGPALRFRPGTDDFEFFSGTGRNAFFQWLYRSPASGSTPNRAAMIRAGEAFRYGSSSVQNATNPYWEGPPINRELSCRQNFHIHLTDGFTNETNNPSLSLAARPDDAMTLPDGRSYAPTGTDRAYIWNADAPPPGGGCASGAACEPTLADIAWAYWATDLRTDLTNSVPPYVGDRTTTTTPVPSNPLDDSQIYWNPVNDPANWQHMVNFTVGLGVAGNLNFPGSYAGLRDGSIRWPGLTNNAPPGVDDLWRAGLVSRGGYFSAGDPTELVDSLGAALNSVIERRGSASAATVTSGIIQASTLAFRTGFDSSDWTGTVSAFTVDRTGRLIPPAVWEAGAVLTARGDADPRVILTASAANGGGIPFRWSALPNDYQASLNDDPTTGAVDDDGLGERRLAYLRGDRSLEANNGGPFRVRNSLLGAVINSGAVVVAAPSAGYSEDTPEPGTGYDAFKEQWKARRRVVYAGANDGMLHAFDAGRGIDGAGNPVVDLGTGRELFAYVPREVAGRLSRITRPGAGLVATVDSTPVVRDVYINGSWRTVLIGALRRGGQGIFALDVTDPESITEGSAAQVVMWEFSDDIAAGAGGNPRNLGFTYGRPNIARLKNGRWVVLLPGSYNSDEPDARTGDGFSSLFVLDIADGSLIREIRVPGSKGLAAPTMGDYDDDFVDEFAVAGDLNGNLWRFDFDTTTAAGWTVEKMFEPTVENARPITSAPRLFGDPRTGGIIAVVGTGKYLEPVDRTTSIPQQRLYGIRDYGRGSSNYPVRENTLQVNTLTKIPSPDPEVFFFSVNNADVPPLSQNGWRLDLLDPGERSINPAGALFSSGLAIFSTIIPNGNDPCVPGLKGNVLVLQGASGGASQMALIDTNGDGRVDSSDNRSVIGRSIAQGTPEGSPSTLGTPGGGTVTLVDFPEIVISQTIWRRRSWREIDP